MTTCRAQPRFAAGEAGLGCRICSTRLSGNANLLVAPSLDAANIAFNLLKTVGEGLSVGPMLLGMAAPVHIVTQSVTTRGVVNMTAYAVVDAQGR